VAGNVPVAAELFVESSPPIRSYRITLIAGHGRGRGTPVSVKLLETIEIAA